MLDDIENYLNNIDTLIVDFIQKSDNNQQDKGVLYIKKPGFFRWEYAAPKSVIIVGREDLVTYYDIELKETSYISIDNILTNLLIGSDISLPNDDIAILTILDSDYEVIVSFYQKSNPQHGILSLSFIKEPMTLKEIRVVNQLEENINIMLHNHRYSEAISKKLFYLPRGD
ncbi:MAG: outer membrane lipoprotein carrier protein LolA [Pseudomonadota bacterium]